MASQRYSKETVGDVMRVLEEADTSVTPVLLATRTKKSRACVARVLQELQRRSLVERVRCHRDAGGVLWLYHLHGRALVPPSGCGFISSDIKARLPRPLGHPVGELKQIVSKAKQEGVSRPWYIACLFGPADGMVPA
jgi:hypothetical protein